MRAGDPKVLIPQCPRALQPVRAEPAVDSFGDGLPAGLLEDPVAVPGVKAGLDAVVAGGLADEAR